ncbi:hypothetical protein WJX73_005081 [Symbiochloris irregularis]|uniref:gluconokinase n=1 Tax=Symbiochloris irregularis TaxID=706552 RepID=A0AAW1NWG5_9CHLO
MLNAAHGLFRKCRQQVATGFLSLSGCPREIWIIFALKILESFNYFSLSLSFTVYLTDTFGVSDEKAGTLYGLWGGLSTLYGFIFGWLIDFLGVKWSFVLCGVLNFIARLIMAATTSQSILFLAIFGPATLATALGVPVLLVGIKQLTTEGNRGFAFALFYSLMNIASLSAGMLRDLFYIGLAKGLNIPALRPDLFNHGSRLYMLLGAAVSLCQLAITLAFLPELRPHGLRADTSKGQVLMARRSVSEQSEGDAAPDAGAADEQQGLLRQGSLVAPLQHMASAAALSLKGVVMAANFWRYMALCIATVNLKSIFRHLDGTLPKYQIRSFGCKTPVGLIYSINPAMIILLVPLVGALTTSYSHYDMIHLGGYLSALSPFWMAGFATVWAPVLFVVQLSLGEAIWSPRWYDLSMSVAPDGREGIFTALAAAPLFLATLPTGFLSGWLLQHYCPNDHACDTGAPGTRPAGNDAATCRGRPLWTVVALVTLSTPIAMLVFQRWLRPRFDSDQQDAEALQGQPRLLSVHQGQAGHQRSESEVFELPLPMNPGDSEFSRRGQSAPLEQRAPGRKQRQGTSAVVRLATKDTAAGGEKPLCYVVAGVSGSGKTTVGTLLARQLGCKFYDGDSFHPDANIAKMRSGQALTDEDRWPWLQRLAQLLREHLQQGKACVLACSSLRQSYRNVLTGCGTDMDTTGQLVFVLLKPSREELERRIRSREALGGHFMPASLLDSQLAALEPFPSAMTFDRLTGNERAASSAVPVQLCPTTAYSRGA